MNYIPNAANLPKGMAHYWFELGCGKEHKNYFLFCQTSDQQIFHATKSELMEFVESKNARRLLLKPWDSIEANGKRKRKIKKGKEKQQPEEEPKKKKRKAIVLPAPSSEITGLPAEILIMILYNLSEPTPDNRRIIFSFLKGPRRNTFSDELTNSELIWKWYRKVLKRDPPKQIIQIGQYYMQRGEYKPFARRWYGNFVHLYDMSQLAVISEFFEDDFMREVMQKKLKPVAIKILMMNLRGKFFGIGKHDDSEIQYELIEIEIQAALDATREIPYSGRIPDFMKRPLQHAMITAIQAGDPPVNSYELRKSWWYDDHDDSKWPKPAWMNSKNIRMNNIFALSEYLVIVIRGLDRVQKFTARDITAYVWLNQVFMKLYYMPLIKAMDIKGFPDDFRMIFAAKMRIVKMSKQEKEAEDKLSFDQQDLNFDYWNDDYFANILNTQGSWADRWRFLKTKQKTIKGRGEAAIRAYKTALGRAGRFIAAEIERKLENTTTTTDMEVVMNEFRSELMPVLVQVFKLNTLWSAATKFVTAKSLGTSPGTVYRNGIAAIKQQQIIKITQLKKGEEGMSSSSNKKPKEKEEEEEEEEEFEWWNEDEEEEEDGDEIGYLSDDEYAELMGTHFWN